MQIPEELILIIEKYLAGKASTEEKRMIHEAFPLSDREEVFVLSNEENADAKTEERIRMRLRKTLEEAGAGGSNENGNPQSSVVHEGKLRQMWKRVAVAASVVGVLFVAGYFIVNRQSLIVNPEQIAAVTNDVQAPDKNRAQIKLADGTIVYLDSAANGELAQAGNVTVIKNSAGEIVYNGTATVVEYNTMFNPRGSKVQPLTLSDGTKVWLNSESSIKYPTAFVGNERKVEITGEAYFEVAHNKSKPFFVSNGEVSVEVLGTHFNVNAYEDEENIKVTLLEGSVRVQSSVVSRESVVIKPREQALSMVNGELLIKKNIDVEEVIAWKNGRFVFTDASIETIMSQVARWYDVEVVYQGKVTKTFRGGMPRSLSAANVFKILEETGGVHFKIEGKKVTVMP